ncbi:MAG: DUF6161 domain-containing protein [Sideroxydans sp.]|nr:DUF6161 domain-containing protein [Sideroxydans sp.]
MSESNKTTAYLVADFGEQGGRVEFKTHEELVTWMTQLQQQWSWLARLGHQPTSVAWQTISAPLNQALGQLQQVPNYLAQGNPQQVDALINAARSTLETLIRNFPWLLANSAQRRFVEELRDTRNSLEAGLIVAHWMNVDLTGAPVRSVVTALLQWELYERGIKDRMKTENAALKKLAGDMQATLTQYQEAERVQTIRFDNLHGELMNQQSTQKSGFEDAQVKRTEAWEMQRNTAQIELDNIKNTYDQHMAIAAPVEYWETKRKKHRNMTWGTAFAVVAGMIGVGCFLSAKMENISQLLAATPHVAQSVAASSVQAAASMQSVTSASATWQLGTFLMLAVLSIWAIRLLVRIFLSNMHLENDAGERVTMAKTYLALIRSDSLSKENNIDIVLGALFRSTGDGIVKDEGLPPSTLDFLTKLGK